MAKKTAPKVEVLKVDLKDLEAPIKRVEVAESTIKKNPDIYHANIIQAQSYATHEANDNLKGSMEPEEFTDLMWKIKNFR